MYNSETQKVEIEQKSKEWLELREKYITASDIPAILAFKEGQDYYKKTPSQWIESKLGAKQNIPQFNKDAMLAGELNEIKIVEKYFNDKEKYSHGDVYTRGIFLASLDVFNKQDQIILEIKHTQHKSVFDKYADYSHPAYMQVVLQMYVTKANSAKIIVTCDQTSSSNKDKFFKVKAFEITKDSNQYKTLVENIEYIESIHKSVVIEKQNPFLEKGSSEFQSLIDAIESRKEKIKDLKEETEIYEERLKDILEQGKLVTAIIGDVEYKYTLQPSFRTKKTLKEDFKEEDVFDIEKVETLRISKTKA